MYNDPLLQELAQEELRPGRPYYSPAHLMNYQKPWHGVPYWMVPGGLPYGQMYLNTFTAPAQPYGQEYITAPVQQVAVLGSGEAPVSGIYTGVEDSCG